VKSAQANHADKQEKSKRMAALLEKGYASTEETETANTEAVASEASLDLARVSISKLSVEEAELELLRQDIALAESAVAADRIALEDAEQRLKETKVYAPMSGVISARMVQVGQIISSPTNNVGGGTELMTLSDLSRIFVLADIDESDIGKIEVGQPAVVTVDAYPDLHFRGEVVRVAVKGTNTSNVVTFDVKVEILDEKKDRLRPEMRADVDVLCGESDDALLVPTEAIQGFGERTFVFVPGELGGEPSHLPVQTGLSDGANTQVLAGPAEGATVLIPESEQDSSWTRDNRDGPPGGMPPGMMGPPPR
jgi:HlyD family secretion protein